MSVDKFLFDPSEVAMTQCVYCRHAFPSPLGVRTCPAFMGAIPDEILRNEYDHRFMHPGQDEPTLFEPLDGIDESALTALYRVLDQAEPHEQD